MLLPARRLPAPFSLGFQRHENPFIDTLFIAVALPPPKVSPSASP
jgi:hypothetical protein